MSDTKAEPVVETVWPDIPLKEEWEANMVKWGDYHGDEAKVYNTWEGFPWYYDGEWVFYQIAKYTNDDRWLVHANHIEKTYRKYVLDNSGRIPGWRIFPHGLCEDYIRTGDEESKRAVLLLATKSVYVHLRGCEGVNRSRETAYAAQAFMYAEKLGAGRHPNLSHAVDLMLGHVERWCVTHEGVNYVQPFMMGLTCHSLMEYEAMYHNTPYHDDRIAPAIRKVADWLWANAFCEPRQAMYLKSNSDRGAPCTAYNDEYTDRRFKFMRFESEGFTLTAPLPEGVLIQEAGGAGWTTRVIAGSRPDVPRFIHIEVLTGEPAAKDLVETIYGEPLGTIEIVTPLDWRTENKGAPDLNMLIAPIYGWLFARDHYVKDLERGDALFAGGVRGAWLQGGKQWVQSYRLSFLYVELRTQAVAVTPDVEAGLISRWPLVDSAEDVVGSRGGVIEDVDFIETLGYGLVSKFGGVDSQVVLYDNDPVWLPAGNFSVALKCCPFIKGETQYLFDGNHGDSSIPGNECGFCLRINGDGRVAFYMTTAENTDEDLIGPELVIGKMHTIVAARYQNSQRLYVIPEGGSIEMRYRMCSVEPIRYVGKYSNEDVTIGGFSRARAGRGSVGPIFHFNGLISDVRLYERALTQADVGELHAWRNIQPYPSPVEPEPIPEPEKLMITITGSNPLKTITNPDGSMIITEV